MNKTSFFKESKQGRKKDREVERTKPYLISHYWDSRLTQQNLREQTVKSCSLLRLKRLALPYSFWLAHHGPDYNYSNKRSVKAWSLYPSAICYKLNCVFSKSLLLRWSPNSLSQNVTAFGSGSLNRQYKLNEVSKVSSNPIWPVPFWVEKNMDTTWAQRNGHLRIQGEREGPQA